MQSSGYLVIPLCALVLEIEICQNSGMRDLSKPIEEMSTCSFFFFFSPPWDVCTARKCQKILGKNAALWEYEVYKFKEIGQLKVSIALFLTLNFCM